jgi:serine protease Do
MDGRKAKFPRMMVVGRKRSAANSAAVLSGILSVLTLALICSASRGIAAESSDGSSPTSLADLKALERQVQQVAKKVTPCVVGVSGGSGVVVSEDGLVLTVAHVGEHEGRRVTVTFPDGRRVRGRTLGNDHGVDAGMVQLDGEGPWPHAELGTSDDLEQGQWCVTLGYPVSFERGKPPVVRLGRVLRNRSGMIFADCKIMGGDSGGPLFDLEGRVIGIGSRCDDDVLLNIHVPIDSFHDNWDRLVGGEDFNSRSPRVAFLGVAPSEDIDDDRIDMVVPGSAAEKAGFQQGDLILRFGDKPVDRYEKLPALVHKRKPGDKVAIVIRRGEETLTLDVTLGGRGG